MREREGGGTMMDLSKINPA